MLEVFGIEGLKLAGGSIEILLPIEDLHPVREELCLYTKGLGLCYLLMGEGQALPG